MDDKQLFARLPIDSIKVAHYTLKQFFKLPENYLIMIASMMDKSI